MSIEVYEVTLSQSQLQVRDVKVCGGPEVTAGTLVSLLYRVALSAKDLEAGRCVESNYNPDVPITVLVQRDQLLGGVYEALIGMRAGGSVRRVYIPATLAYGHRGAPAVPPDSDLWMELCVSHVANVQEDSQLSKPSATSGTSA
jgi:FKBP-type peptidyl-prolyl cis-trans isomerase